MRVSITLFMLSLYFPSHSSAQVTVPIDNGSVSISTEGKISGSWQEVGVFPGFPDEIDQGSVSGSISPTGAISGSFQGTDTYNENQGGTVVSVTEPYSGSFSGSINPTTGQFTVSWGGPEPGSWSGTLPTSVIPGDPNPPPNPPPEAPKEVLDWLKDQAGENDLGLSAEDLAQLGDFSVEEINNLLANASNGPPDCF